jgi:hypothetical protein
MQEDYFLAFGSKISLFELDSHVVEIAKSQESHIKRTKININQNERSNYRGFIISDKKNRFKIIYQLRYGKTRSNRRFTECNKLEKIRNILIKAQADQVNPIKMQIN